MKIAKEVVINPEWTNYQADGRATVADLFQSFQKLEEAGWARAVVVESDIEQESKTFSLPIICWTTRPGGPAFWILSGVHGEEPAGPNALARNTAALIELGKKIPVVLFPLLNPAGYARDWRYPNEYRDWQKGTSVSSAEHLLLDFNKPDYPQPRRVQPESKEAEAVTSKVLELVKSYPPLLALDHHEDEALEYSYLYSQRPSVERRSGESSRTNPGSTEAVEEQSSEILSSAERMCSPNVEEPVAKEIIDILKNSGIPIQQQEETRFGEKVINGIVQSANDRAMSDDRAMSEEVVSPAGRIQEVVSPAGRIQEVVSPVGRIHDGSIDELLAAEKIIVQGQVVAGPAAPISIVIETPVINVSLEKRIEAHQAVIQSYERLWGLAKKYTHSG